MRDPSDLAERFGQKRYKNGKNKLSVLATIYCSKYNKINGNKVLNLYIDLRKRGFLWAEKVMWI